MFNHDVMNFDVNETKTFNHSHMLEHTAHMHMLNSPLSTTDLATIAPDRSCDMQFRASAVGNSGDIGVW